MRIATDPVWMRVLVGRRPGVTLARLATIIVASVLVFGFWLLPVRAHGPSMLPTFEAGSLRFVNTLAYAWRHPGRADIVAIRMAGRHAVYVKRVIGLPGERVRIASGVVHVDGAPIDEPYVRFRADWDVSEVALGPDEFFVIGDNRGMRARLHEFGIARRERLVGKILF